MVAGALCSVSVPVPSDLVPAPRRRDVRRRNPRHPRSRIAARDHVLQRRRDSIRLSAAGVPRGGDPAVRPADDRPIRRAPSWPCSRFRSLYLIALEILPGRPYAYVASLLYAIVPRGWDWLVAGGGLTRSSRHAVFALLGIWQLLVHVTGRCGGGTPSRRRSSEAWPPSRTRKAALFFGMTFGLLVVLKVRDQGRADEIRVVAAGGFLVASALDRISRIPRAGSSISPGRESGQRTRDCRLVVFLGSGFRPTKPVPGACAPGPDRIAGAGSEAVLLHSRLAARRGPSGRSRHSDVRLRAGGPGGPVGLYDAIGRGILRVRRRNLLRSNAVRGVLLLMVFLDRRRTTRRCGSIKAPPFDSLAPGAVSTMDVAQAANTPEDSSFAVVSGAPWFADVYGEWLPALRGAAAWPPCRASSGKAALSGTGGPLRTTNSSNAPKTDATCVARWMKDERDFEGRYVYVRRQRPFERLDGERQGKSGIRGRPRRGRWCRRQAHRSGHVGSHRAGQAYPSPAAVRVSFTMRRRTAGKSRPGGSNRSR